jgi:hypothetical protein
VGFYNVKNMIEFLPLEISSPALAPFATAETNPIFHMRLLLLPHELNPLPPPKRKQGLLLASCLHTSSPPLPATHDL